MSQKIRIKLKSYDHQLVDKSAEQIVKAVQATDAIVSGLSTVPHSLTRRAVSSSSSATTSALSTSTALQARLSTR